MDNNLAINPNDYFLVSSTLGWENIFGCMITHVSLGLGIIKSKDTLLRIHFVDDPPDTESMFYPSVLQGGKFQDLEVSPIIVKKIETILGFPIHKRDVKISRGWYEIFRKFEQHEFDLADRIFVEIKQFLDNNEVEKYQAEKSRCEKEFITEQNTILLETSLVKIREHLQNSRFSDARALFKRISHLYAWMDFEQEVLKYQIPFELKQFQFQEADNLFARCTSITQEAFQELKATAIINYFSKPETSVTREQALALADYHQNLLIKARAGSGKTRVLACKTALLIDCYKVNPDKILVLAFNKKAAVEIGNRIQKIFGVENFENTRTFHSLAYQLVGISEKILFDDRGEFSRKALSEFVQDVLRSIWSPKRQKEFYELFRKEMDSLEFSGGLRSNADYIAFIRTKREITLRGDRVKSAGEKYIADYLFEHDIPYFYERVEFWSGHQYRPDFTLFHDDSKVVIEFWGIDENDARKSSPEDWSTTWDKYHDEQKEKRKYWKEKRIPLVDLSIVDTRLGRDRFEEILEIKLAEKGIKKAKLDQQDLEKKVIRIQKDRMTELFVQFIQRTKKQMWSVEEVQERVRDYITSKAHQGKEFDRRKLFNEFGNGVFAAYQKKLEEENSIDFDDLLIKASTLIRDTQGNCSIDLGPRKERHQLIKDVEWILVDEFQDFSLEFFTLIDSIRAANPNVRLVCVGDDWQAINSFAGSDLSFFEHFLNNFQNSHTVNLLTNHRSKKKIVDFGNKVMVGNGEPGLATSDNKVGKVEVQFVDDIYIGNNEGVYFEKEKTFDQRFIFYEGGDTGKKVNDNGFLQARYLKACYQILRKPENWKYLTQSKSRKPIVAILSRTNMLYQVSLDDFLDKLKHCFTLEEIKEIGDFKRKIKIGTAHGFKGLEAEIGIILRVCNGSFPLIHSDTILFDIFGQTWENALAEERRLFYVAATRPSQNLYLLTERDALTINERGNQKPIQNTSIFL